MMRLVVAFLAASALSGCGETSNYLGDDPGGGGASAGQGMGGKAAAGSAGKAGTPAGGSTSQSGAGGTGPEAGSGGVGVAGSGTGGAPPQCEEPKALEGNWSQCGDGTVHRTTPGKCPYTPSDATLEPLGDQDECSKDSDCTAKPFGLCQASIGAFARANRCNYGCEQDSDCDAGRICVCADTSISSFGDWSTPPVGSCHPIGNCTSDADCGSGLLCTPYDSNPGCYSPVFTCQAPGDECASPRDCAGFPHASCSFDGTHRVCAAASCVVD